MGARHGSNVTRGSVEAGFHKVILKRNTGFAKGSIGSKKRCRQALLGLMYKLFPDVVRPLSWVLLDHALRLQRPTEKVGFGR